MAKIIITIEDKMKLTEDGCTEVPDGTLDIRMECEPEFNDDTPKTKAIEYGMAVRGFVTMANRDAIHPATLLKRCRRRA